MHIVLLTADRTEIRKYTPVGGTFTPEYTLVGNLTPKYNVVEALTQSIAYSC
jgi:hypothetical protein